MTTSKSTYGLAKASLAPLLSSLSEEERKQAFTLSEDENNVVAADSLKRFPLSRSGIDWESHIPLEQHFAESDVQAQRIISAVLQKYCTDNAITVALWGNLAIPAFSLPTASAIRHMEEIIETSDDLWLYLMDFRVMIEYLHSGYVSVGQIP
ncbi:hypothetical protein ACF06W_13990 [Streptomyces albus]|uniref:CDI toxin immunity protein n=1 Tax=Streptomyces albus TaxID=1888 RepID=UPI0036FD4FDB